MDERETASSLSTWKVGTLRGCGAGAAPACCRSAADSARYRAAASLAASVCHTLFQSWGNGETGHVSALVELTLSWRSVRGIKNASKTIFPSTLTLSALF